MRPKVPQERPNQICWGSALFTLMTIPYRSYEVVEGIVNDFIEQYHPTRLIPIPIERIVEFGLSIEIVPVLGLTAQFSIEAALSNDFSTIHVDEGVMKGFEARYRYSLAHEVGHHVMHGDVYPDEGLDSVEAWLAAQREWRASTEYDRCEGQALDFAGLVLVPTDSLGQEMEKASEKAGRDLLKALRTTTNGRGPLCRYVGEKFGVSAAVIERRMIKSLGWQHIAQAR